MIIQLILLILISLCIKFSYDLHKCNNSATLIQLQNPNHAIINDVLHEKSPLIVHNLAAKYFDFENISIGQIVQNNPGYIIIDNQKHILLSSFTEDNQQVSVMENSNMIDDFKFKNNLDEISHSFMNKFTCNLTHNISLLKGSYSISLLQNKHDNMLYTQLFGNCVFYIFNPKHRVEIQNRSNLEIKKWAFKIILKPGVILSIPPEWYYFYESEEESILCSSYFDSYFTYIYNQVK